MTEFNYEIGHLIKLVRVAGKLTQVQLAKEIKCSRSYLSKIESGDRKPGMDFLTKISKWFKIPVDMLDPELTERDPEIMQKFRDLLYTILSSKPKKLCDKSMSTMKAVSRPRKKNMVDTGTLS